MARRALFSPTVAGVVVLALAVACGGGTLPDQLALEVAPASITFVPVAPGEDVPRTVTLTHIGSSGTIKLTSVAMSDATSPVFSVDAPAKTELLPGESAQLVVHYRPQSGVAATGELEIRHNVAPSYISTVTLKALAAGEDLVADPDPVDFGDVSATSEKTKDLDIAIWNAGTKPVTVTDIRLASPDTDFEILPGSIVMPGGAAMPATIEPRGEDGTEHVGLTIRYTPKGGGCDSTELWVMVSGKDVPVAFAVEGCELGPRIVVTPGQVDFGYVKPGETRTVPVTISNEGNDSLVVTDIALVDGTDAELKVAPTPATSVPPGPWTVPAGGKRDDVVVSWKAVTQHDPVLPFDSLRILSNDSAAGAVLLPVYGTLDAPDIALVPSDVLDFSVVAQTVSTLRTLTIRNDGHGELAVQKLEIDKAKDTLDEFAVVANPAFPPTTGAGNGTVAGYAATGVEIRFTNKGGDHGDVVVPLTITSNSPGKETLSIDLKATRGGKATCEPVLIPATVNFGLVAVGQSKTLPVNVHNKGTGNCTFVTARVDDCPTSMFGGSTCPAAFKGTASKTFKIVSMPPSTPNGIGPGMDATIVIEYTPPDIFTLFGAVTQFHGLLAVRLQDGNVSPPADVILPAGATPAANVKGSAGSPQLAVQPGSVAIGMVTIGCWSKTYQVCLYSSGSAPVEVSDIALTGCSPEFKVKDVPPLPASINAGLKQCFGVAYAPQDPGPDECMLVIESNDKNVPKLGIPLSGAGTYESEQTDVFTQANGQSVDVLFIIDDSASMCDWQDILIANYPYFISHASLGNDYHIGVISVNVGHPLIIGRLNRGDIALKPRYITPGPQAEAQFEDLADLGCSACPDWAKCTAEQSSSAQESGLQAAQVALSAPLTTDTGKQCGKDSDCTADPILCGDPATCPYYCIEGTCGGWNKGFLRDDAQLEMIVLSDEEDQSPAALAFYIDFLKNIKGFYNVGMMHFHSITFESDKCEGDLQGDGKRYREVSAQTGGETHAICIDPYKYFMNKVGLMAFQPKVQFFLTRLADPPTVTVKVDGASCAAGWKYDTGSNSVVFDAGGACMPQPGATIEIHYKTLCLTS
jgi:hypothetical protein